MKALYAWPKKISHVSKEHISTYFPLLNRLVHSILLTEPAFQLKNGIFPFLKKISRNKTNWSAHKKYFLNFFLTLGNIKFSIIFKKNRGLHVCPTAPNFENQNFWNSYVAYSETSSEIQISIIASLHDIFCCKIIDQSSCIQFALHVLICFLQIQLIITKDNNQTSIIPSTMMYFCVCIPWTPLNKINEKINIINYIIKVRSRGSS